MKFKRLDWIVFSFCFLPSGSFSQSQGNIWYFGLGAGLSFNSIPPSSLSGGQTYYPPPNQWNEGTSAISDSAGSLLFYSNGASVWNRNHEIMPNGGDLMGHPSSTQSALIIPRPGSMNLFDLFTTDASEHSFLNGLRHSVIDMCLDEENGDVLPDHKNILLHGSMAERLAAVQHSNGHDYWVVGHEYQNNVFHVYLLTANGIQDSSSIALGPIDQYGWGGQIVFSPDGGTLAYAVTALQGFMALYDFDTFTGVISSPRVWINTHDHMVWGLAFSPNGSKLYLTTSNQGSLRQLDLLAGNWSAIQASEVTLDTHLPDIWKDIRLGPDGKIYVTQANSQYLSTIQYPNEPGTTSQFVNNSISLDATCSFGLPNFIPGYAYNNETTLCHGTVGITSLSKKNMIYPNPVSEVLFLDLNSLSGSIRYELIDQPGRTIGSGSFNSRSIHQLDVRQFARGSYTLMLYDESGKRSVHRLMCIDL